MRNISLVCLLLSALWWAEARPTTPILESANGVASGIADDGKQSKPSTAADIPADAAVLTIKGLCDGQSAEPAASANASCQTVITRVEFEKLVGVIQPDMTPTTKRQFATSYPRLLVMSHEAERQGLDKLEHFQQMLAYSRLQLLSQELVRSIRVQAAQVPEKDIEDYYRDHITSFERVTVERVYVPITKETANGGTANQSKPEDAAAIEQEKEATAKEAQRVRERAIAGEEFNKLQREVYDTAGVTAPIPTTKLTNWRRGSLPAPHLSVFDLKVGEVSQVISDPRGHWVYKLDSRETESLEEARKEIHNILFNQRGRDMMKKIEDSAIVDVNVPYFGTPEPPKPPDLTLAKPESDND
jgi:PPIC-type PPIASE domain